MSSLATLATVHRQSHFSPAFFFLSRERKEGLQTLYAVARLIDDAVDTGQANPEIYLDAWRSVFKERDASQLGAFGHQPLAEKFLETADRFQIPLEVMRDLIDKGVAIDLKVNRFQTAMDLEAYCYGVAGTIGLACLPIFGVPVAEGRNFAIRLGTAIQWTNTLRDVGVDAKMGRIYLPLDHLEQFGYTENELFAFKNSSNFQALLTYEWGVAKSHYKRAAELMPAQWKSELLPARIMWSIYEQLLDKLKSRGFPVIHKKIRLNFLEKGWAVYRAVRK